MRMRGTCMLAVFCTVKTSSRKLINNWMEYYEEVLCELQIRLASICAALMPGVPP